MNRWFKAKLNHQVGHFNLNIDLSMDREIGVLFGPNGAGKSLTLRLLAGLDIPKCGSVCLGERRLINMPGNIFLRPRHRKIGLVFQELALFPHLTVLENIAYGLSGSTGKAAALQWLHKVHLKGMEHVYPAQLSGGQKQRVALARALAPEPEMLLLDEPFSSLDGPIKRNLRRELKRLHRETGVPILYVTHDIEDVYALGDRIFFIKNGKIIGNFPLDQLWSVESRCMWKTLV